MRSRLPSPWRPRPWPAALSSRCPRHPCASATRTRSGRLQSGRLLERGSRRRSSRSRKRSSSPYALGFLAAGGRFERLDILLCAALYALFLAMRSTSRTSVSRAGDAAYGKPTLLLAHGKTITCAVTVPRSARGMRHARRRARRFPGGHHHRVVLRRGHPVHALEVVANIGSARGAGLQSGSARRWATVCSPAR